MKNDGLSNFNAFLLALGVYIFVVGFVFFRFVMIDENAILYTDLKDSFIDIELSEPSKQIITQNKAKDTASSKQ